MKSARSSRVAEASRGGLGGRLRRAFMSQVLMKFDTMYLCTYVGTYVRTYRTYASESESCFGKSSGFTLVVRLVSDCA